MQYRKEGHWKKATLQISVKHYSILVFWGINSPHLNYIELYFCSSEQLSTFYILKNWWDCLIHRTEDATFHLNIILPAHTLQLRLCFLR